MLIQPLGTATAVAGTPRAGVQATAEDLRD